MLTATEKIEGTPFLMRWEADKGYSFGIGNYRLSEWYKTEQELKKEVKKINYNTINGMIGAMLDATLKLHGLIK